MTARPIGNPEGDNPARNPKWTAEVDSTLSGYPENPKIYQFTGFAPREGEKYRIIWNTPGIDRE